MYNYFLGKLLGWYDIFISCFYNLLSFLFCRMFNSYCLQYFSVGLRLRYCFFFYRSISVVFLWRPTSMLLLREVRIFYLNSCLLFLHVFWYFLNSLSFRNMLLGFKLIKFNLLLLFLGFLKWS